MTEKLSCTQLTERVYQLTENITELFAKYSDAVTEISVLRTSMADQLNQHAEELAQVHVKYDRKLQDLRLELSTRVSAESTGTINAVTGFFGSLDAKLTKYMKETDIQLDVFQNETLRDYNNKLNALNDNVKTLGQSRVTPPKYAAPGLERFDSENENNVNFIAPPAVNKAPTVATLEARLDKLEDQSRRDNLLFYGFNESKYEKCENMVRDLLARKILRHMDVNGVIIVRAHRLGPFKAGYTRPIIVKFREYADKEEILKYVYKGTLTESGKCEVGYGRFFYQHKQR